MVVFHFTTKFGCILPEVAWIKSRKVDAIL